MAMKLLFNNFLNSPHKELPLTEHQTLGLVTQYFQLPEGQFLITFLEQPQNLQTITINTLLPFQHSKN